MHYESIQKKFIIFFQMLKLKYFFIHKPALPVTAVKYIFFRKHKLIYIKIISSQAFSPTSPVSIMKEISTRTMLDMVKEFNTEELIEYLRRKNLKLDKDDIIILRKEKIASLTFLKLTKKDFRSISFALGLATVFTEFNEGLNQKLRNYFSLKTLNDLKKMLRRNKVNKEDITNIKQFTSGR